MGLVVSHFDVEECHDEEIDITLSALKESLQTAKEESMSNNNRSFTLPANTIDFGFHPVAGRNALLFNDGLEVQRKDPNNMPDDAVVYGSKPLTGTAEFEVEILRYRTNVWGGTLRIGVMWCKTGSEIIRSRIPQESERGINHCVWWDNRVYNRFAGNVDTRKYGLVDLYDLGEGDRVGMQLTLNGDLVFLVNGERQGIAALDVHKDGYDVYPVVDVCTRCYKVRITRAGQKIKIKIAMHALNYLENQLYLHAHIWHKLN